MFVQQIQFPLWQKSSHSRICYFSCCCKK